MSGGYVDQTGAGQQQYINYGPGGGSYSTGAPPPYYTPQQQYIPQQQPSVVVTQPAVVISGGACPHCHVGYPREDYGCCAICLAIWFFPIGILCCLAMKERKCSHCGANL